ncbi:TetR family transcriptional regulator [Actinoalloteichus spitiensis]|uniref:TetR/AcrR family transcriptional regulator n=1 Tax=Actinoalloteichus spitiensis TaxID=252394 RepID=UPI00036759BD|nr:TetR family transcriptional regulator [Actinoalloteichus spitiensis]
MTEPRRRNRSATRQRLLAAARHRFAKEGYEAASVRDIAADAGVDAALVFRYFGSKKGLFEEAAATTTPTGLLDGPPEELPARLLHSLLFEDWSAYAGEHPLVAMLRSSAHDEARDHLREELCGTYVRALERLSDAPDAALRAELFSAWMLGIGVLRSVVGTPAVSAATPPDLAPHLAAVASALFERPVAGSPPPPPAATDDPGAPD